MLACFLHTSNGMVESFLSVINRIMIILYTEITEASVMMEALSQYVDNCNDEADGQQALSMMNKIYIGIKALDDTSNESIK